VVQLPRVVFASGRRRRREFGGSGEGCRPEIANPRRRENPDRQDDGNRVSFVRPHVDNANAQADRDAKQVMIGKAQPCLTCPSEIDTKKRILFWQALGPVL